ncbi:MAG TPA: RNA polymerase sigma factor SigJ [Labilithrix sp.]|jgi:RNA polymerase sigma-70 factor (ECF subfamily)
MMDAFEEERSHLFAVAYRMLGSAAEADDVLQEAWIRWSDRGVDPDSPRAFLTTVVVRLCLDQLKSARARRETYVGPWLPEPLVAREAKPEPPDARAELAESLSLAFLVLLERLSPLERAAFLLREVFDEPYDAVARTLETSETACRQLVARARAHVDENRPRFAASEAKKRELLQAFLGACAAGDADALGRVLAADVVARSDGGGKVQAALKPIVGRDRVMRFIFGIIKKFPVDGVPEIVRINGEPGVLVRTARGVYTVLTLSIVDDAITDVWIVSNPDKLTRLDS